MQNNGKFKVNITAHTTLSAFTADEWDRLNPSKHPFLCYAFLKALEDARGPIVLLLCRPRLLQLVVGLLLVPLLAIMGSPGCSKQVLGEHLVKLIVEAAAVCMAARLLHDAEHHQGFHRADGLGQLFFLPLILILLFGPSEQQQRAAQRSLGLDL